MSGIGKERDLSDPDDRESETDVVALAGKLRVVTGRVWRQMRRDVLTANPQLTPVRIGVLSWLDRKGPLTVGALAAAEQMHASTMTRVVDALEERGLVTRHTAKHDRRVVIVSLTRPARKILQRAHEHEDQLLSRSLESLTLAERALLADALSLIERFTEDLYQPTDSQA